MSNPSGDSTIDGLPPAATLEGTEQFVCDQIQGDVLVTVKVGLNQIVGGSPPSVFGVAMLAWFLSLETTLPASPGILWNNEGTLALS